MYFSIVFDTHTKKLPVAQNEAKIQQKVAQKTCLWRNEEIQQDRVIKRDEVKERYKQGMWVELARDRTPMLVVLLVG